MLAPGRPPGAGWEGVQAGGGGADVAAIARGGEPLGGQFVADLGLPVAGAGHGVLPEGDAPGRVQPGADLHHRRRAEGVQEELLPAIPDHLHRGAGLQGQPRGFHRLGSRGLAAEGAADGGRDDADLLGGQLEGLGHLGFHPERRLDPGPDRHPAVLPLGQRGMRLEGGMGHVGVEILRLDRGGGAGFGGLEVPLLHAHLAGGQPGPEMVADGGVVQGRGVPSKVALTSPRALRAWSGQRVQDRHQVAIAQHAHAGHALGRGGIDALEGGAVGRGPHDAGVQRAGHALVGREPGGAEDLLPGVQAGGGGAHQGVGRDRFRFHLREVALDPLALDQLPVGHLPGRGRP